MDPQDQSAYNSFSEKSGKSDVNGMWHNICNLWAAIKSTMSSAGVSSQKQAAETRSDALTKPEF